MKKIISLASLAALLGFVASLQPTPPTALAAESATETKSTQAPKFVQTNAKSATLRVKFVYDGKPPAPEKIDGSRDAFCAAIPIVSDKLIVSKDGAIKNVVLMFDERKSKADVPAEAKKAPEATHKLDNKGCMFEPHVLFARPGQTIEVVNSDQTGHNANFNFFKNTPVNILIPIGGSKEIALEEEEPAPIPVECNVHPWMKAHVIVLDHPYVGITDEDGVLEITDLPVGEVTFRAWHESADGAIDEVLVGGKKQKWSRGRMEIELKPGINDLGVVTISADKFKK